MLDSRAAREPQPGERAALIGMGVSNRSLASYLARRGVKIHAYDQKNHEEMGSEWERVSSLVHSGRLGKDYLSRFAADLSLRFHWVFVTPGMRKDVPQLDMAREAGCRVSSELALFMALCPATMIGVTGSSGKTTTASLVSEFLRGDGATVHLGGNIGNPLTAQLPEIRSSDLVVLEISSFQLELADTVPQIAAILNITPDHLDVHGSMDEYVKAKSGIVLRQNTGDFSLLNADCKRTRLLGWCAPGEVGYFSTEAVPAGDLAGPVMGNYSRHNLWLNDCGRHRICRRDQLPLRGMHNVKNVLAASILARRAGASLEAIRRGCEAFVPVPHRLEEVDEIDGVLYVNDSIATSPERARAALQSYNRPLILMMGGYDKGLNYDGIAGEIADGLKRGRIQAVVAAGSARDIICSSLRRAGAGTDDVIRACNLDAAFAHAKEQARSGDVILLSPACASFDEFANYRERGAYFRRLVNEVRTAEQGK